MHLQACRGGASILLRAESVHRAGPEPAAQHCLLASRMQSSRLTRHPGLEAQNRPAFAEVLRFVVGPRSLRPLAETSQRYAGIPGQDLPHQLAIGQEVGGKRERAPGAQQSQHQVDRFRIEEPPLLMAGLWPRVRKVHVRHFGKAGRQHGGEQEQGIGMNQHEVTQPAAFSAPGGEPEILAGELDTEEPLLRRLGCGLQQEASFAEAELYLPGAGPGKQGVEVERRGELAQPVTAPRGCNRGPNQRASSCDTSGALLAGVGCGQKS